MDFGQQIIWSSNENMFLDNGSVREDYAQDEP